VLLRSAIDIVVMAYKPLDQLTKRKRFDFALKMRDKPVFLQTENMVMNNSSGIVHLCMLSLLYEIFGLIYIICFRYDSEGKI